MFERIRHFFRRGRRQQVSLGSKVASLLAPNMLRGRPGGWTNDRVKQAHNLVGWVFVAITAVAEQASRSRMNATRVSDDGLSETPVPFNDPLVKLIRKVNDIGDTQHDHWYKTCMWLDLTGISYWWMTLDVMRRPMDMWVVPSTWVRPIAGGDRPISAYEIKPLGNPDAAKIVTADEILEIKYPSPISETDGYSPLRAGGAWVDVSDSIDSARWHTFQNGHWPGLKLILGEEYADITRKELERLTEQLAAAYGGVENAAKVIAAKHGMDFEALTTAPVEMDFAASAEQARDMVLAMWRVPKVLAGITQEVNFASFQAALQMFCRMTVQPRLDRIAHAATGQLATRFDPSGRIRLSFPDCVPNDPENIRQWTVDAVRLGLMGRNEFRSRMPQPLGPWEDADDVAFVPVNTFPVRSGDDEALFFQPGDMEDGDDETPEGEEEQLALTFQSRGSHNGQPHSGGGNGVAQKKLVLPMTRREKAFVSIFMQTQRAGEQSVAFSLRRVFRRMREKATEQFQNGSDILLPSEMFREEYNQNLMGHYKFLAERGARAEMSVSQQAEDEEEKDSDLPEAIAAGIAAWLAIQRRQAFYYVWETTDTRLSTALQQARDSGLTDQQIIEELNRVFARRFRDSMGISRTIATQNINFGAQAAREGLGIPYKKWLSVRIETTRDHHWNAHGQVVRNGDPFLVGGEYGMYPGDPQFSAFNVVHCLCTAVGTLSLE